MEEDVTYLTLLSEFLWGGGSFKMAKGSDFLELEVKIIKIVVMLNYLLSENIAMLNVNWKYYNDLLDLWEKLPLIWSSPRGHSLC